MIPAKVLLLRTAVARVSERKAIRGDLAAGRGESRLTCFRGGGGLLRQVLANMSGKIPKGESLGNVPLQIRPRILCLDIIPLRKRKG